MLALVFTVRGDMFRQDHHATFIARVPLRATRVEHLKSPVDSFYICQQRGLVPTIAPADLERKIIHKHFVQISDVIIFFSFDAVVSKIYDLLNGLVIFSTFTIWP
jgi:hypothetical protein